MQQTTTYQLNKIDVDDNFSPAPLNENMDKVEAKFAALDNADAALDSRITLLEGHTIAIGTYKGTGGTSQSITVGFRPKVVCMAAQVTGGDIFIATDLGGYATLTDSGFIPKSGTYVNLTTTTYMYLAIK